MSDVLTYLGAVYAWLLTPAGLVLSGVLVVAIWADVAVMPCPNCTAPGGC